MRQETSRCVCEGPRGGAVTTAEGPGLSARRCRRRPGSVSVLQFSKMPPLGELGEGNPERLWVSLRDDHKSEGLVRQPSAGAGAASPGTIFTDTETIHLVANQKAGCDNKTLLQVPELSGTSTVKVCVMSPWSVLKF